jgi:hypothetical protein
VNPSRPDGRPTQARTFRLHARARSRVASLTSLLLASAPIPVIATQTPPDAAAVATQTPGADDTVTAPSPSTFASDWTGTLYGARMSSETGWEDILLDPIESQYVDVFLVAAAMSRPYAHFKAGALTLEAEGQVVRYFGDQDHWELNVVPLVTRWHRFPWSDRVATSAAFGLGLSYATELPPVEVEIEGESAQLLVYWVLELTAGPTDAPWSVSLRMHHRSVSYGLMADEGGMNAVGLGVRYRFGGKRESDASSRD